ncbi:MAG: Transcriptional regulatory protein YpdB [Bacteroidota bacterium]|jgi:DNA-binding LytR/AlgR family response regulator
MDIHLSDGISFNIFEQVNVKAPIIFTTAYEQYAIKAFQVNGIGYLLKPIVESDLVKAVNKLNEGMCMPDDLKKLLETMSSKRNYKSRITTKIGDKYTFVDMSEVAYFYSENRVAFVVTKQNKRHIVDYTLENLEPMLDPQQFFRLTRNAMASVHSIHNVSKYFNSRLKITLKPEFEAELLVSRVRVSDFLKWLDGE